MGYPFCSDEKKNKIKTCRFNPLILHYYQNNNIFGWDGNFGLTSFLRKNLLFNINTNYNSEMIKYLDNNFWKDTYNLNAYLKQDINENFSINYIFNSLNFDDHQTGLENDYRKLLIGIKPFYNHKYFYLNGGLSGIVDERMSKKDRGWNFQLSFENDEFDINDYHIDISSYLSKDKLGKRNN